jgi:hypothetical protein
MMIVDSGGSMAREYPMNRAGYRKNETGLMSNDREYKSN